ncbi:MAG: YfiR family protein [Bacteroidota bacterium]
MKKLLLTTSLVVAMSAGQIFGQASRPIHEIHSMMLYNFTKYIQWPESSGAFVIGVVGDENVYQTLNNWYNGKLKGNRKFKIVRFSSAAEVTQTDILYVSKGISGKFDEIKAKTDAQRTLIITDKVGLGKKGSNINFKMVNNRLAFELNEASIEASGLKVSSQLMNMAILI